MTQNIINDPFEVEGTVTGRLTTGGGRGSAKNIDPTIQMEIQKRQKGRAAFAATNLQIIKYVPREIHAIKGQSSREVLALMAMIREQEKFRSDPRFPIFQMQQRNARYKAIFQGIPFRPMFS